MIVAIILWEIPLSQTGNTVLTNQSLWYKEQHLTTSLMLPLHDKHAVTFSMHLTKPLGPWMSWSSSNYSDVGKNSKTKELSQCTKFRVNFINWQPKCCHYIIHPFLHRCLGSCSEQVSWFSPQLFWDWTWCFQTSALWRSEWCLVMCSTIPPVCISCFAFCLHLLQPLAMYCTTAATTCSHHRCSRIYYTLDCLLLTFLLFDCSSTRWGRQHTVHIWRGG